MKKALAIIFLLAIIITLQACQSRLLTVYKIDVQQGNAVEAKDVEKIKVGMSKEQVLFVLGSPLVTDSFHPDRWDYIYFFTPGYGDRERRHLTLYFDRDEVIEIVKDNIVEDDYPVAENEEQDELNKAEEEALLIEETEQEQLKKTQAELEEEKELEKEAENLEKITNPENDLSNP